MKKINPSEKYYLQNGIVGNCVMWWRIGSAGYTSDLLEAQIFKGQELIDRGIRKGQDIPWLVDDIRKITRVTVDCQNLPRTKARRRK